MIVSGFEHAADGAMQRIAATIAWEDSARDGAELFFAFPAEVRLSEGADHGAFLLACAPLAMLHGERRVRIDAPVCPMLREGVETALRWLARWHPEHRLLPRIEVAGSRPAPRRGAPVRAACFLSGGIDSTFMLRRNRMLYGPDDPAYIRDALFVHGFDIGKHAPKPQAETFEHALRHLSAIAERERARLVPGRTNIRHIDGASAFWTYEFHGAALAAAGFAATSGPVNLFIAATNDIRNMIPWGSHPLLDANYGSQRVRMLHDGVRFSRLQKVAALSDRPELLDHVRVCTANAPGLLNCGRCEKCIRTRLELLAVGRREHRAFPDPRLAAEAVRAGMYIDNDYQAACYGDLIAPLRRNGHGELARIVAEKLRAYRAGAGGPAAAPPAAVAETCGATT